jgi:hypothetical protein
MAISKKIRFEIFKRDNFTCRYCGKKPPEVMLEMDHLMPISEGGKDDLNNLLTSCFNCNRGKGKILIDTLPNSITENLAIIKEQQKQTKQYYQFIERIEQQKENDLREIGRYYFNLFAKTKKTHDQYIFAGAYKASIKIFLKSFTKYEIIEAIDIAFGKFGRGIGEYDRDRVFRYMCGVLHNWKKDRNGITTS